jgi:hypothetical protein
MIHYLPTVFTFLLLVWSIRRIGLLPFPTALILILEISQVLFTLAHEDVIDDAMLESFNFGGLDANFDLTLRIYSLMALFSVVVFLGKFKTVKGVNLNRTTLVSLSNSAATLKFAMFAIALVVLHLVIYSLVVDWQKLWFHRNYLEPLYLGSGIALPKDKLYTSILGMSSLFAILSIVCFCVLQGSRSVFFRWVAAITSCCYFTILLAINSRTAAIVPGVAAIFFHILGYKGRKIVVPVMSAFALIAIISALNGRNSYEHGISAIPDHVVSSFTTDSPEQSLQVVLDFFQGIFVVAESLQVHDEFRTVYKVLSFSPLPGLIDGYAAQRKQNEQMLSPMVPMSGLCAAINFGFPYVCVLIGLLTVMTRVHVRLVASSPVVFLLCNFLLMFCCYVLLTYPVRNAFRYGWLALFIASFELIRVAMTSGGVIGENRKYDMAIS